MSSIPSNLARVPNMMASRLALASLNRTNVDLLTVQQQISTGRAILLPSDDIIKAATISVLDDRLDRSEQLKRNLSQAAASLGVLDSVFQEAHDTAQQAKSIASQQVGTGTSASERASQATIVDQLINSVLNTANRTSVAGYVLGGSQTTQVPVTSFSGGYRYNGQGNGLITDLGMSASTPITVGQGPIAGNATLHGSVDLNPNLAPGALLSDLGGARGTGVALGTVNLSIDGGTPIAVDLSGAATVQDVTTRVTAAIRQYETSNSVTVLGPGGVSTSAGAINMDIAGTHTVQFSDIGTGVTAQDLGLQTTPPGAPLVFSATTASGLDTQPKLSWQTTVASLAGLTGPLGSIRISNAGQSAVVDLSSAQTLQDVRNLIEGANVGVHVRINAAGTGIDIVNDVSASSSQALSISEVSGTGMTATALGIRTFTTSTRISDLNFGRGVTVVNGVTNPQTGLPDPSLNTDFRITLGDPALTTLDIDLRPQDMTDVQSLINRINSEAAPQLAAAGLPPTAFSAHLVDGANGLGFTQDASFTTALKVTALNNSPAAGELGLLAGTYDPASATLIGEDRAKVRVDSLFTHLIDLRDSLRGNDTNGISLAGQDLGTSLDALAQTRGVVGGYAKQVDEATVRENDRNTLDQQTRSELQDTDFTAAATRFSLLQTQLQAGLQMTAMTHSKSLLDFLG
jgi:flagellin-like hook-associated protein FlgL